MFVVMNLDTCIDPPVLIRPIRADDGERLQRLARAALA